MDVIPPSSSASTMLVSSRTSGNKNLMPLTFVGGSKKWKATKSSLFYVSIVLEGRLKKLESLNGKQFRFAIVDSSHVNHCLSRRMFHIWGCWCLCAFWHRNKRGPAPEVFWELLSSCELWQMPRDFYYVSGMILGFPLDVCSSWCAGWEICHEQIKQFQVGSMTNK